MLLAQLCGAGNTAGRYACKSTICLHSFACKSRGHFVTSQLQIVDLQRYACSASLSSPTGCCKSTICSRFACTASLYKTLARLRLANRRFARRRLHSEAVLANRRFARVGFVRLQTRRVCCTAKLCKQVTLRFACLQTPCAQKLCFCEASLPELRSAANLRFAGVAYKPVGFVRSQPGDTTRRLHSSSLRTKPTVLYARQCKKLIK